MPRALRWSKGGGAVSYDSGTPIALEYTVWSSVSTARFPRITCGLGEGCINQPSGKQKGCSGAVVRRRQ